MFWRAKRDMDPETRGSHQQPPSSTFRWGRFLPFLIVTASLVISGLILLSHARATAQLKTRLHEEHQLRMGSSLDHVEELFDAVYSTLLFISLDDDVVAMRRNSQAFIQKLYDHQWEHHRLSEVYVIERDFPGNRRPFMTFERSADEHPVEEIHSLSRELEEYRTQQGMIQQFLAAPDLPALISREIRLCVDGPDGQRARGFVYAVPIRSKDEIAGIVAGMVPTHILHDALRQGQLHEVSLLVNERREIIGGQHALESLRRHLQDQLDAQGAKSFFAQAPESFAVDHWIGLWAPAQIVAGQKWWLVYLYDKEAHLRNTLIAGAWSQGALAGSVLLAGIALAFMTRTMGQRLEEQALYLRERKVLEKQVQDVSEREQSRIGEKLHEDLCQRLSGIHAVSRVLEKRLSGTQSQEGNLAGEIVGEVHETLKSAQELADELQPVALLAHGFYPAVAELAARAKERSGIPCEVTGDENIQAHDSSVATHLYRIAQEALGNAIQHSQATRITVNLAGGERQIQLTITDNGVGLPQEGETTSGMGLRIMRYRSELIGAELEIKPAPDGGTFVRCTCPNPAGKECI